MIRRVSSALLTLVLVALPALAQQAPPGQSEYVPMKQLPPGEQMPAAPLLVGAYAFIWVAVAFYLWTIWRRLNKVEADLDALTRKIPPR